MIYAFKGLNWPQGRGSGIAGCLLRGADSSRFSLCLNTSPPEDRRRARAQFLLGDGGRRKGLFNGPRGGVRRMEGVLPSPSCLCPLTDLRHTPTSERGERKESYSGELTAYPRLIADGSPPPFPRGRGGGGGSGGLSRGAREEGGGIQACASWGRAESVSLARLAWRSARAGAGPGRLLTGDGDGGSGSAPRREEGAIAGRRTGGWGLSAKKRAPPCPRPVKPSEALPSPIPGLLSWTSRSRALLLSPFLCPVARLPLCHVSRSLSFCLLHRSRESGRLLLVAAEGVGAAAAAGAVAATGGGGGGGGGGGRGGAGRQAGVG